MYKKIKNGDLSNDLLIRNKNALIHLAGHLSDIENNVTIPMTFEEFKEKRYLSDLQKLTKFKKSYDRLLKQCKDAYESYVNSEYEKSALAKHKKEKFIHQLKEEITQAQEEINSPTRNNDSLFETVSWYILPPGEHPFAKVIAYFDRIHGKTWNVYYEPERLRKIYDLNPTKIYGGKGGFTGYVAFYFEDINSVVLENPMSGNAIYIIKRDWKKLSQLTKAELLRYDEDTVIRIVHSGDWFSWLKYKLFEEKSSYTNLFMLH